MYIVIIFHANWLGSCQWVMGFRSNSTPKDVPYPGVPFLPPPPPPPPPKKVSSQEGKLAGRKKNINNNGRI